jgi:hypothetical protein
MTPHHCSLPPCCTVSSIICQARVLLHLGRPLDVAERGLVFVQNFLGLLAAREGAGALRPWFKEVGACNAAFFVCVCVHWKLEWWARIITV